MAHSSDSEVGDSVGRREVDSVLASVLGLAFHTVASAPALVEDCTYSVANLVVEHYWGYTGSSCHLALVDLVVGMRAYRSFR